MAITKLHQRLQEEDASHKELKGEYERLYEEVPKFYKYNFIMFQFINYYTL